MPSRVVLPVATQADERFRRKSPSSVTPSASWRPTSCGTMDRPSARPGRVPRKKSSRRSIQRILKKHAAVDIFVLNNREEIVEAAQAIPHERVQYRRRGNHESLASHHWRPSSRSIVDLTLPQNHNEIVDAAQNIPRELVEPCASPCATEPPGNRETIVGVNAVPQNHEKICEAALIIPQERSLYRRSSRTYRGRGRHRPKSHDKIEEAARTTPLEQSVPLELVEQTVDARAPRLESVGEVAQSTPQDLSC